MIIISGLKAASEVIVILLLAIFIATIFTAFLEFLKKNKIPKILSIIISVLIFTTIFMLLVFMLNHSLNDFMINLPMYERKVKILVTDSINILAQYGIFLQKNQILELLDINYFAKMTTEVLGGIGVFFSKFLLVGIGIGFILAESKSFEKKLIVIFKNDINKLISFRLFSQNIKKYFIVKTFTSFLTGILFSTLLFAFNVDYPILWGVLALLFNFVPVVGSIVATIPAILLSLINLDINITLWLIAITIFFNIFISNIIEPKLMGRELGLSPMVIFFALIFMGWTLGVAGMFLAVPITMTLKIAFEATDKTKWVAILLSDLTKITKY